jgi:hypothetical protein
VKAADWQPNTVRGFISILGKKGGEKIESSKSADRERTCKDQVAARNRFSQAPLRSRRGGFLHV